MTDAQKLRRLIQIATESAKAVAGRTGGTAQIESLLPEIWACRAEHHTWEAIAHGLTALGLFQVNRKTGQSEPLTGRRLSALVTAINAKEKRRAARNVARRRRPDLVRPIQARLVLSPDLGHDKVVTEERRTVTEQDIRASALQDLQTMMRKDLR